MRPVSHTDISLLSMNWFSNLVDDSVESVVFVSFVFDDASGAVGFL
jgi:hypothetical protein